jgi:hypothetical protein
MRHFGARVAGTFLISYVRRFQTSAYTVLGEWVLYWEGTLPLGGLLSDSGAGYNLDKMPEGWDH